MLKIGKKAKQQAFAGKGAGLCYGYVLPERLREMEIAGRATHRILNLRRLK